MRNGRLTTQLFDPHEPETKVCRRLGQGAWARHDTLGEMPRPSNRTSHSSAGLECPARAPCDRLPRSVGDTIKSLLPKFASEPNRAISPCYLEEVDTICCDFISDYIGFAKSISSVIVELYYWTRPDSLSSNLVKKRNNQDSVSFPLTFGKCKISNTISAPASRRRKGNRVKSRWAPSRR